MPVRGLVRARRHLFARQSAFGTPIAAVRAYPFSGVPDVDEQWTDPAGDFGSIDPVAAPYRGAGQYGFNGTIDSLNYNDLPLLLSGILGGGVTSSGAGTAKTRIWTPASDGTDEFDVYTYEFGDDVDGSATGIPNDWFQLSDGTITDLTIDSPEEGAGVLTASAQWSFGAFRYAGSTDNAPSGTIPSITDKPDTDATPLYLKDAKIYIDSDPSDIGQTQLTDSVHKFTLHITQEKDDKRYANGDQTFDVDAYGRGARAIEVAMMYAKTADTVGVGSESDAWSADSAVDRYLTIAFTSKRLAEVGIYYSWSFSLPMRYYTRTEGNIGGNTVVNLTGHAFLDSTVLDYAFYSELVNTLTDAEL